MVLYLLNKFFAEHMVSIIARDPDYMTPAIET